MSTQFNGNPRQIWARVISEVRQKLRDLSIEMKSMWRHRNFGRVWYLIIHCIGVIGYTAIALIAAFHLFLVVVMLSVMDGILLKSEPFKSARGSYVQYNPIRWLYLTFRWSVMAVFRLFSGFMGWGSEGATPAEIPGRIFGSIAWQLRPSHRTQIFGYLTLAAVTAYVVQLLFVVYGG